MYNVHEKYLHLYISKNVLQIYEVAQKNFTTLR